MERAPAFMSLLAADDRRALEEKAWRRRYARGATILHSGEDAACVLVVLDGRVKVTSENDDGREAVLGFLGPGDVVGEIGALDRGSRSSTVAALEPVMTMAVGGQDFRQLLAERPGIGQALLRVLASRLRDADSERADFVSYDVTGRVARRIIELCDCYGSVQGTAIQITLPLTQEDLAGWTGATREAVAKALATLRRLGWLETNRRAIVVTDFESLHAYAESCRG